MFLVECQKRGINCSKPFSGKLGYDFITENNGVTHKVQVKTTAHKRVRLTKGTSTKKQYLKNEVDFFALLDAQINQWFIVPYSPSAKSMRLNNPTKFIEAWNQLKN
jgi:hypothetical protein